MKNLKDIFEGILDPSNKGKVGSDIIHLQIKEYIYEYFQEDKIDDIKISNTTNKDGKYVVDVKGSLYAKKDMTRLVNDSFVFYQVTKHVYIVDSSLETLEGGPVKVGGDFVINRNKKLKSLVGSPETCMDYCANDCTTLKSFEGITQDIGGDLFLTGCILVTSFKGLPKTLYGGIDFRNCDAIKRLTGFPKTIHGSVVYDNKHFDDYDIEDVCKVDDGIYHY